MFFIKSGEVEISKLIVVSNDENANSVNDMNFSNYVGSTTTAVTS